MGISIMLFSTLFVMGFAKTIAISDASKPKREVSFSLIIIISHHTVLLG
jgi:L-fucose mutarotase/ribose pyranase (RbsD/FucU family)